MKNNLLLEKFISEVLLNELKQNEVDLLLDIAKLVPIIDTTLTIKSFSENLIDGDYKGCAQDILGTINFFKKIHLLSKVLNEVITGDKQHTLGNIKELIKDIQNSKKDLGSQINLNIDKMLNHKKFSKVDYRKKKYLKKIIKSYAKESLIKYKNINFNIDNFDNIDELRYFLQSNKKIVKRKVKQSNLKKKSKWKNLFGIGANIKS